MNIHRYLLPASIAAAFHVALFLVQSGEFTPGAVITEVPLPPWTKPPEEIAMPPEQKSDTTAPVQPLAGGPTPPVLPDTITAKPTEISIPLDPPPQFPAKDTKFVPKTFGPGDLELPGPGNLPQGIYSPAHLDRVPNAKVQIAPDYPAALRHSGTTGFVKVEFDVDTSGRVIAARAVESSQREFEEPALRAVRKWQFEPGRRLGKAVPFRIMVPIEFGIERD